MLALVAAAIHGGLLIRSAAFSILAGAFLLARLHTGLHVFAAAARLSIFLAALVFAAAVHCIFRFLVISACVVAARHGIFRVGGVMAAALRWGLRSIRCRSGWIILRPRGQREDDEHCRQFQFHKISFKLR